MKINNMYSLLNKNIESTNKDIFIKGTTINGKLVEKIDSQILIQLNNNEIVKAESNTPLNVSVGEEVEFIVKEMKDGVLYLTPKENISTDKPQSNIINKVIEKYNMVKSDQNVEIIKGLINLDMNIDKDSILAVLRKTNALDVLYNKVTDKSKTNIPINVKEVFINNDMSDLEIDELIKHSSKDLKSEADGIIKLFNKDVSLTNEGLPKLKETAIKSLLFLQKNNMKITLSNLKLTMDLFKGENFISSNLKEINDIIGQVDKFNNVKNKLDNLINNNNLLKDNMDRSIIKNYYDKLTEIIDEINEKVSSEDKGSIKTLLDNTNKELEYLKDINKNMTLLYYPINIKNEEIIDNIYMFNKNKNKFKKDKFKIFFSLNTDNLDKIDISYEIFNNKNIITFKLKDNEIANYIEENRMILEEYLDNSGIKNYSININISTEENMFDPLDDMNLDNYVFDARV